MIGLHTVSGLIHDDTNVTVVGVQNCASSLRKKLLGLVDQTIASWNQMVSWLRVLHSLRGVA